MITWCRLQLRYWRMGRAVWRALHASSTGSCSCWIARDDALSPLDIDRILEGVGVVPEPDA